MRNFVTVILIVLVTLGAAATTARSGSYGTELPFVAGTGGRASALGLAGVSLTESPSLMYFNPGVLRRHQYKSVEFYRTTLFDSDAQYLALSYVHPTLDYGTFGVSILRVGVGGVEQRDVNNNLLGEIEDSQTRVLVGYGFNAHRLVTVGFNLKMDRHSFGDFSDTGVGFDIGVHADRPLSETGTFRAVRAGLALENIIEPSIKLDQDDVKDPFRATFGASVRGVAGEIGFTTALDVVAPRFSPVEIRFGQEVTWAEYFSARFGMQGSTPTFGVGGRYRTVALDYAYRSEDLGSNHRISLTVGFGKSLSESADERNARLDAELQTRVSQRVGEFERLQLAALTARADSLFGAGDFAGALDQYEVVLLWDPANEHAQLRSAECLYRVEFTEGDQLFGEGDYVAALYRFRRALQVRMDDPEATAMIQECQRRIDADADRSQMIDEMLRSAIDLYAEGRYREAQVGFREVIRIDPGNRIAREYEYKSHTNVQNAAQRHILRSRAYADRNQYASALAELEAALELTPNDNLRAEYRALRKRQKEYVERADHDRPVTRRHTAPPARTMSDEALASRYETGMRYFERGDFERASRSLLEVWTVAPDYRNVADVLARSYLFLGMKIYTEERYDEAIRIWEKILAIDPGNTKAQRYLQKTREEAERLSGGKR